MSKPSRLARPSSAGAASKLPSARKESHGRRPRAPSVGEKLMRAGSEGNLVKPNPPAPASTAVETPSKRRPNPPKGRAHQKAYGCVCGCVGGAAGRQRGLCLQREGWIEGLRVRDSKVELPAVAVRGTHKDARFSTGEEEEPGKGNLRVTSPEDAEHLSRRQSAANGSSRPDPKSCRGVPRRHTVGGPRGSREILGMQPSDMDKKREAFLEHLKQKYPHHASAIMGHQERLREQGKSPKHSPNPQPGVGDQGEHLSVASLESLDAMSEGEAPTAFTRGTRSRASLPVVRSTNQTKDRSLGVLYLQYGDETKQIRMPNEITSADTIRALFVSAFPQQLTMKMLESPSVAVYIKDDVRNMYYELSDVRNITDHSFLKVYHKDPAHAFSHNARPTNGDSRMHREMLYGGREGQHTVRQQSMGPPPAHPMQGSLPPPAAHSMPPSPSRIPFGPRGVAMPGSATIPRDRLSGAPQNRSVSPCPSAILERRDVKPDEDVSCKGGSLARGEGLYADPFLMHDGRLSIASSHSGHPGDVPDHGFHRASIRSNSSYASSTMSSDGGEHHSLYRQKSRKYTDSQLPTLGSKTPPPSPHRMADVRLVDIHPGQAAHIPPQAVTLDRGSPVRQSFRKDGSGQMETVAKARGTMASPVIPDLPPLHGHGPNDPQTRERMKAMEQQIASLTGLVQHALFKGPNTGSAKEVSSDKMVKRSSPVHTANSGGVSPILAAKSPAESSPTPPPHAAPAPLQTNLAHFRKNVSDLRLQLHQMRQLQLQNQETLKQMVKRAEQEISGKLVEAMKRLEDPVQRQRALVEEDRHKYLCMEERVLVQLGELEQYVDELKKESSSSAVHRAVTLKDVEDGAVGLRKVGESLAGLKGEFPVLQTKMRSVLRVEVEAVKFLKEEPHKLDSMLKRVKTLTETLSGLRRLVSDGPLKGVESPVVRETSAVAVVESEAPPSAARESPPPAPSPTSPTANPESQSSSIRSEVMPASPLVIHHAQSAPVHMHQSQQSAALMLHPSPPLTPVQGRDSPTVAKINTPTTGNSPALPKKPVLNPEPPAPVAGNNGSAPQNLFIDEVHNSREKSKQRAMSIEAAEKEWQEKRQNMGQYDGKEFDKILQEAQANMMKGIPNLEVGEEEAPTAPPAVPADEVDTPQPVEPPPKEASPPESSAEKPVSPGSVPPAQPSPPPVAEKPAKLAPEKPAKLTPEKLAKLAPEKPAKPSLDKVAKLNTEKVCKSPPPPPPRRNYAPGSGLTTGRSGEVIFTSRKESVSAQEGEEEAAPPQPPKPSKVPPEIKPKPQTPPPIAASAICEEEDEGDRIMAELQVFQKCTVKDVGPKCFIEHTRVEPQVRELRPGSLMLPKDKKNSEFQREEKESHTDENGNDTMRQSPGVIYYVTAQISKEQPSSGAEDQPERKEATVSPSQVANVNAYEISQRQQQLVADKSPVISEPAVAECPPSPPAAQPPLAQIEAAVSLNEGPGVEAHVPAGSPSQKEEVAEPASLPVTPEKQIEAPAIQEVSPVDECPSPLAEPTSPPAVFSPELVGSYEVPLKSPDSDYGDQLVLGSSKARVKYVEEYASLSPDLPGEESLPPPDNIAFMITNTKVQALSCGEYQEIVNTRREGVQTVKVDGDPDMMAQDDNGFNKKPVIIIFDEPMDIRSAYKRLSTIFECEEELERMLSEERIEEENEEELDPERCSFQVKSRAVESDRVIATTPSYPTAKPFTRQRGGASREPCAEPAEETQTEPATADDGKQDAKKKFKFKFPKKQLAALTQAIRTGTKTGKKTLQVVVYEEEEEPDGTLKQQKEAKRFEIGRSKSQALTNNNSGPAVLPKPGTPPAEPTPSPSDSHCRTDEIRKNTYKTLDSLEQTIKQLENTISEMGPRATEEVAREEPRAYSVQVGAPAVREAAQTDVPSPKGAGPRVSLSNKAPHRKKAKPQLLPRPAIIPANTTATTATTTSEQNTSVASSASRMPVPVSAKSRQPPGGTEKAGKQQKLQDPQRQFRQANGSAKKSGGENKSSSPTLPASKIPAFYPSSGKSSSLSAPNSDATNPINASSSSSSSSKSSIPSPSHANPARPASSSVSSHIPSLSNGTLKLPSSTHTGAKSIRTIHTPSFTSYKPHNGNGSKSTIPSASSSKDTA
ncbi:hypothetical protein SKAU_G00073500 [Synaphobranchus kaupii]|uniref:Actin interacting protein 3-like C-terminal domain-containing protein n=1 Tax=Synaphobranchus kaupii TaxID=118154 RepID=A0A9Q1JBY1_SYNKA|nr:hypothetical protein SKAU_G00073500 [Synaphobranchus kaupii]